MLYELIWGLYGTGLYYMSSYGDYTVRDYIILYELIWGLYGTFITCDDRMCDRRAHQRAQAPREQVTRGILAAVPACMQALRAAQPAARGMHG
jgi:hypothetical protein